MCACVCRYTVRNYWFLINKDSHDWRFPNSLQQRRISSPYEPRLLHNIYILLKKDCPFRVISKFPITAANITNSKLPQTKPGWIFVHCLSLPPPVSNCPVPQPALRHEQRNHPGRPVQQGAIVEDEHLCQLGPLSYCCHGNLRVPPQCPPPQEIAGLIKGL